MQQALVSSKYQIVIPKAVRRKLGILRGHKLNLHITHDKILLYPSKASKTLEWPNEYIHKLKSPWTDAELAGYLNDERKTWTY